MQTSCVCLGPSTIFYFGDNFYESILTCVRCGNVRSKNLLK